MRVLVVEDSRELLEPLVAGLQRSGYAVDSALDGRSAFLMAESIAYDVIVLDIMLPAMDGLTLLKRMRARNDATRVLLLTARDTPEDRVTGLRSGADDYLVKPFSFDELLARIEALLRRGRETIATRVRIGPVVIDMSAKTVVRDNAAVALTPREYHILEYLVRHHGRVVSRVEIEEHVYDNLIEPMSNVVDSAVCSIRRKLDDADQPSLVQTRRGMGYIVMVDRA